MLFKYTAVLAVIILSRTNTLARGAILLEGQWNDRRLTNATVVPRTVYDPPITDPHAGTLWRVGTQVSVTWNTEGIPQNSNPQGQILLGYLSGSGPNEHLDMDHPLATEFALHDGAVEITVPNVTPGNDYIVVLMGDSGNRSPAFTIQ